MMTLAEALRAYAAEPVDEVYFENVKAMLAELGSNVDWNEMIDTALHELEEKAQVYLNPAQKLATRAVMTALFQSGTMVGVVMERQELVDS
jgi:hypothetical protein